MVSWEGASLDMELPRNHKLQSAREKSTRRKSVAPYSKQYTPWRASAAHHLRRLYRGYRTSRRVGLGSDLMPISSTAGMMPHLKTGFATAMTCSRNVDTFPPVST